MVVVVVVLVLVLVAAAVVLLLLLLLLLMVMTATKPTFTQPPLAQEFSSMLVLANRSGGGVRPPAAPLPHNFIPKVCLQSLAGGHRPPSEWRHVRRLVLHERLQVRATAASLFPL